MPRMQNHLLIRSIALVTALPLAGLSGCAFSDVESDIDRNPIVNTGAGATIIYPGQTAPGIPGSQAAPGSSTTNSSGPNGESHSSGSPAGGGGNITMIGGAEVDDKRHYTVHEEPLYYKYALLPLAVLAAPFVAIADAFSGDEEEGPEVPEKRAMGPAPEAPAQRPPDFESQRLDALEQELDQRIAENPSASARPAQGAAPGTISTSKSGEPWRPSIADELAALQRVAWSPATHGDMPPPSPPTNSPVRTGVLSPKTDPGVTSASPTDASFAAADGIIDRDGDGRIDHWIFRENGEIVRAVFDENGDGSPDRTLLYDRETHRISRVEEDTNFDGTADSWSDFKEGALMRRRSDDDGNGQIDSWSYFRGDELTRHERDTTGDGFRDRVSVYNLGILQREEQDRDADGQMDLMIHYDSGSKISRRDEDSDGDGHIDTISHYENGRLARKELLDAAPIATAPTVTP